MNKWEKFSDQELVNIALCLSLQSGFSVTNIINGKERSKIELKLQEPMNSQVKNLVEDIKEEFNRRGLITGEINKEIDSKDLVDNKKYDILTLTDGQQTATWSCSRMCFSDENPNGESMWLLKDIKSIHNERE